MSADAVSERYNIVLSDRYELFEYQIPVERFIKILEGGEVPDEVCVVNLGEAFEEGRERRLSQAMQDRALDLSREGSTIQFAVEGSIQPLHNGFELLYENDLYRLDKVFGADLTEHDEGWLTATF